MLNDYSSSEYIEWIGPVKIKYEGQSYWTVKLKLRAINGFGGKILTSMAFLIQDDQVVKVLE